MKSVIKTENLTKHYKDVIAADQINLDIKKGEIYGFLGLNGAGKTTTIRMLLGLIRSTKGHAFINGTEVNEKNKNIWNKVGYLVEIPYSYPNLTVKENLDIIRRLRSLKTKSVVDEVIEKLQLGAYQNRKVKNLSQGNIQRLGLAKALLHHPEILILDEPTNGLDPAGIYDIREMLSDMAIKQGVTIFISSHILDEITRFATRIGIIHQGQMIREFETNQLDDLCDKHLLVKTKEINPVCQLLSNYGYQNCELNKDHIRINDSSAISYPDKIATLLVNAGYPPTLLQVKENLESYFLRTIKNKEL